MGSPFADQIKALCERHKLTHLDVSFHADTQTFYASARDAGDRFGHGYSEKCAAAALNGAIREVLSKRGPNLVTALGSLAEAA